MQSPELRARFLAFFEAKGHRRIPSDSLIPSGDPTVLFTSAGMNQFKDCFLGKRTDLTRAASCQKCLRTGDLDRVGRSPSHHSFFEMLGNFSFGDYFKAEAIQWGWEFLTGTLDYAGKRKSDVPQHCLPLAGAKLWVSIYEEDAEAERLWRALGVPAERIKRFGQAENFWPANAPTAGPNGPCGPCSEIYYDPDGAVQGARSVEVWNLVFTQFDRQPDGSLTPLSRKGIDTGMGLERLAAVMQGVPTDYDTDLFKTIVTAICHTVRLDPSLQYGSAGWRSVCTAADHIRGAAFLIAEGLLPSNEERGYVLRMLIRRAHWHGGRILWNKRGRPPKPFLDAAINPLLRVMGDFYPELKKREQLIREVLRLEEMRFSETLQAGNERIQEEAERLVGRKQQVFSGDFAFMLKDTYGFPFELFTEIVEDYHPGFTVESDRYKALLKEQQERSRAGSQFGSGVFVTGALEVRKALTDLPPKDAQFVGYESLTADVLIKGLWDGTGWVTKAAEGQAVGIVLDRSPFYGEAGGQVGDAGRIEGPKGAADVTQTTWADDVLVHHATIRQGALSVQEAVRSQVDPQRRLKVARSHTAAHLLHWALRTVLGPDAVQAGSYVEVERVRFDFSSLAGLREEQRAQVEALVNSRVRLADEIRASQMRLEEAKRDGALALFGEKYGQKVRVVTIGDYSKELCGGTHLSHTGFVGTFTITGESSIAAGTRRIEALVGDAAAARQQQEQRILHEAARRLSRPAQELVEGLEELLEQLKRAERERKALQVELATVQAQRLVAEGKMINGVTVVTSTLKRADREVLATLADAVRHALRQDGVVLLASSEGPSQVSLVMAATDNLAPRVHAGQVLKAIAPLTQGSGGGRPEFAQAGGKDPSGIPAAFKRAEELLREALQ